MKGFPNQVTDLAKLAAGMRSIIALQEAGENARDDGVLGQALVYADVAGRGHIPVPAARYIQQQLRKKKSDQSFRTTARGLRELYSLLGFIVQDKENVVVTDLGRRAAGFAGEVMDDEQIEFWRRAIGNMEHYGNDNESSHPYQVLLRLIGQRPGISRAKSALALEARNDSAEELRRIIELADLDEGEIRRRIGVSKSNWDNAKKVLPGFAEQLGDVIKEDGNFTLADAPGAAILVPAVAPVVAPPPIGQPPAGPANVAGGDPRGGRPARAPRSARQVNPETIGRAGTADDFDDVEIPATSDPEALAQAINLRRQRLRRHNLIVKDLAKKLEATDLYEDPFDLLSVSPEIALLIEVKTLDGTLTDERDRVRSALAQLLYYEAFVTAPLAGLARIEKIACFEGPISVAHREWLNRSDIGVIWKTDQGYAGDERATRILGQYLD